MSDSATILATIHTEARTVGNAVLLPLRLPSKIYTNHQNNQTDSLAGCYFLARCSEPVQEGFSPFDGPIYYRRPLFVAGHKILAAEHQTSQVSEHLWTLILPQSEDVGYRWLHQRQIGQQINLLGPFGKPFHLESQNRNLLLMADLAQVGRLFPLIEQMLDQGGRVVLLLNAAKKVAEGLEHESVVAELPLAVEVRLTASAEWAGGWQPPLSELLRWADQLCIAAAMPSYQPLAYEIQQRRYRLETGFAQVLVDADLMCGVGACLACVVPTAGGGLTRACVHGPVLDLTRLAS